ncbi:PEP-CTERM sorting domain-containing protein [uncultured Paraglaciecola sp.]|uniref:PEP-CTERM sorting domain-containing protein n=1 Tax=uncultured Paraglaciecola sp. TaxID=1765024 RepID=UPI0025FC1E0A|nr:PEP-CTERM sorting domain-containing protein [uncultured Paraglaciecola sp.]
MFTGNGNWIRRIALACLVGGFSVNSAAVLMAFNDQATFQTAIGTNSSTTLDFDSVTAATPIVNGSQFQGVDFLFTDGVGTSFDGQVASGFDTTSGDNYLGFNDPNSSSFLSGDSIVMNLPQMVHAIGFFIIASPGDLLFSDDALLTIGSGSAMVNPTPNSVLADGGEIFFLGLVDTDGFTTAELSSACCGFFEFNVDDIQFSTFAPPSAPSHVPEPATLSLFCLSLLFGLTRQKVCTNKRP